MTLPLGFVKTKQREFFFVSPFVLLLAYAWTMTLCLWRSLCRRLDFIPLFCLLFCPYAYANANAYANVSCEPGLNVPLLIFHTITYQYHDTTGIQLTVLSFVLLVNIQIISIVHRISWTVPRPKFALKKKSQQKCLVSLIKPNPK